MVMAFGELLWDVLPSGPVLGGAPANYCFRLTTLGINAKLVSRVGCDEFGTQALAELKAKGVDISLVQQDEQVPTGTVSVEFDHKRNATYIIHKNVAYDSIQETPELLENCAETSVLCFGSLVLRSEKNRSTLMAMLSKASNATKICDINLRKDCYCTETLNFCLMNADILKLNDQEALTIIDLLQLPYKTYQDFAKASLEKFNLKACLVTRAENGVYAVSDSGTLVDLPGHSVSVQDTIGSGDAFTAGFTAMLEAKSDLATCCEFGNSLGAAVATTKGGMSAVENTLIEQYKALKLI